MDRETLAPKKQKQNSWKKSQSNINLYQKQCLPVITCNKKYLKKQVIPVTYKKTLKKIIETTCNKKYLKKQVIPVTYKKTLKKIIETLLLSLKNF